MSEEGGEIFDGRESGLRRIRLAVAPPVVSQHVELPAEPRPYPVPDDRVQQPVVKKDDRRAGAALLVVDSTPADLEEFAGPTR
jgi:hypothetical protein